MNISRCRVLCFPTFFNICRFLVDMSLNEMRKFKYAYLLIGLCFFFYVVVRAMLVGVTCDEVGTIDWVAGVDFWRIIFGIVPVANNHSLNTFLIKLLLLFFGDSLFVSRIPNVLSFPLYLYFSYKIIFNNIDKILGVGCFFVLSCNPFLLDFFGLARGYGMSIALMMGALYFCAESIKSFSLDKVYKSLIFASLSVMTVYSMVYFFLGLFIVLNLVALLQGDKNVFKRGVIGSLIIGGGTFVIVAPAIIYLKVRGQLWYGGDAGFYKDTLWSVVRYSLYSPDWSARSYMVLNVLCLALGSVVLFSFVRRRGLLLIKNSFIFILVFIGSTTVLLNYLFGVFYPVNRVALFLYPLATLLFFFCLNDFKKGWRRVCMCVFVLTSGGNFFINANFHKTVLWSFDAYVQEIWSEVNQVGESENRVINLASDPLFLSSLDYYTRRSETPFVRIVSSWSDEEIPDGADFFVFVSHDPSSLKEILSERGFWREQLNLYEKNIFLQYPDVNVTVFKDMKKRQDI